MPEHEAALYEAPFEYVRTHVKPVREHVRRDRYRNKWWLHAAAIPGMRKAMPTLSRYIATPETSKHRLFVWLPTEVLADHALVVFCAATTTVSASSIRASTRSGPAPWARSSAKSSPASATPHHLLRDLPFPPDPTPEQRARVGEAARRLVELRDGWLNPPDLAPADPANRTLTNLHNQRPTWLLNALQQLDEAVCDAYRWSHQATPAEIRAQLLALNGQRHQAGASLTAGMDGHDR